MQKLEIDKNISQQKSWWPAQKMREAKEVYRHHGLKGVIKYLGWKVLALLFAYYLVRDISLYIILPWYIASKISN